MNRGEFLQGRKDIAAMMITYAPIAMIWGAYATGSGLMPLQASSFRAT